MNNPVNRGVLRILKLKGMATAEDIRAALGENAGSIDNSLASLTDDGHIKEAKSRYRMTSNGKARLATWLEEERAQVDVQALNDIYEQFHPFNSQFKTLATNWQIRDGEPNDHDNPAYDNAILSQLGELHQRFMPLVERAITLVPRLTHYVARFDEALSKVESGDHAYFLRPIIDSYHTIWFELHEDLIDLTGKSRTEEATAGRAQ